MMRRTAAFLTASLLAGVLFLAYSGVVSAGHLQATAERANLLENCFDVVPGTEFLFEGSGAIDVPADTPFWVGHGWGTDAPYKDLSKNDRKAFDSHATTFELAVDGTLVSSGERRVFFDEDGTRVKLFFTDFRDGMTGTHVFTGMWFVDGREPFFGNGIPKDKVPVLRCDVTVTFVS